MKRLLLTAVAVLSLSACVLRVPGLSLGAPAPSSSSSGSSSDAPSVLESSATKAWRAVLYDKERELESLRERVTDLPKPGSTSPDQHADWALRLLKNDTLAEVAAGCAAGTYRGEALTLEGKEYLKADQICPLVVDRAALLKKTVHAWGVAIIDSFLRAESGRIDDMEKDKKVSTGLLEKPAGVQELKDYVASFAKKTFEAIGEPVPEEALAKAEPVVKRRQEVIMKLAAAGKIERSAGPDSGAEKAIRDAYARTFDVKKVIMKDAEWKLVKNDYGVLLRHYKNASVLVRAKDGTFCALVPASVGQPYEANGKYANTYGVDSFIEASPVNCP